LVDTRARLEDAIGVLGAAYGDDGGLRDVILLYNYYNVFMLLKYNDYNVFMLSIYNT